MSANNPSDLIPVEPHIPCFDFWAEGLPEQKALAYRRLREEGQISALRCFVSARTGACTVSYLANQPHPWVLETLGNRAGHEGPARFTMVPCQGGP